MTDPVLLVIVGGAVSLISTLATVGVQNILEWRKIERQFKQHPAQVIYNKQTEFFDKVSLILPDLNNYITSIDVWLDEAGSDAQENVKKLARETVPINEFYELLEQYYMYLPKDLLNKANKLYFQCMELANAQTMVNARDSIDLLFSFQNKIRKFVGIDQLSNDMMKAFGYHPSKKRKAMSRKRT